MCASVHPLGFCRFQLKSGDIYGHVCYCVVYTIVLGGVGGLCLGRGKVLFYRYQWEMAVEK